jgi:hypothetical protein
MVMALSLVFQLCSQGSELGHEEPITFYCLTAAKGTFRPITTPATSRQLTESKQPFEEPEMFLPNSR